jgi:hypothetical protein
MRTHSSVLFCSVFAFFAFFKAYIITLYLSKFQTDLVHQQFGELLQSLVFPADWKEEVQQHLMELAAHSGLSRSLGFTPSKVVNTFKMSCYSFPNRSKPSWSAWRA